MKEKLVVLRATTHAVTGDIFLGPRLLPRITEAATGPLAVTVQIEDLDQRQVPALVNNVDVLAVAPAMPMRLKATGRTYAVRAAGEPGSRLGGLPARHPDHGRRREREQPAPVRDRGQPARRGRGHRLGGGAGAGPGGPHGRLVLQHRGEHRRSRRGHRVGQAGRGLGEHERHQHGDVPRGGRDGAVGAKIKDSSGVLTPLHLTSRLIASATTDGLKPGFDPTDVGAGLDHAPQF